MTVKIVTDTLSDITGDLVTQLGVTVVPLYVRFGEEVYRDIIVQCDVAGIIGAVIVRREQITAKRR